MARSDVHSPTNLQTEDYDFLGCLDWGGSEPDLASAQNRVALINFAIVEPHRHWAHVHPNQQCDHCGAHIRYAALFLHVPTNEVVEIGETCMENRFSLATAEFQKLRKQAELDREQHRIRQLVNAFVEKNPDLAWMADRNSTVAGSNFFLSDVAYKLRKYGELSDKQVEAVRKSVVRDAEFAARRAENAAAKAAQEASLPHAEVPESADRLLVTGEVLSTREPDNNAQFPAWHMLVRDDKGYKLWGSIPSSIWSSQMKGRRVQFFAKLTRSDKDPQFGFYSRPSQAKVL